MKYTPKAAAAYILAALLAAFLCASAQQEPLPIQGTILQVAQGSLQVQDQVGMLYTITTDARTVICHFTEDRRTAAPSRFSELREGDSVVIYLMPPGGGALVASRIGFWHKGETPRSEWFSSGESGAPAGPSPSPGYTTPTTDTDKAVTPDKKKAAKGGPDEPTGVTAVTDPNGHFTLSLPPGWVSAGTQDNIQFFTKQAEKSFAFFIVASMNLPPEMAQMDILSMARRREQELAAQMRHLGYQQLGLGPFSVGRLNGACHKYTYKNMNNVPALDEDYYFRTAQAGIVLHFESRPEMFETFRKDIQQTLQSLKLR